MGHADIEELRDQTIADLARRHAAAIATNIRAGHEQTLGTMADEFALRVSQPGVTEQLIRAAMSCGPLQAGQMLIDLIQKGIDGEAGLVAVKEVEHMEANRQGAQAEERRDQRIWAVAMRDQSAFGGVA